MTLPFDRDQATHEAAVAARNLIDREGWVQGKYQKPRFLLWGGGYCAVGAIRAVTRDEAVKSDLTRVFWRLHYATPMSFNDAKGCTKAQVLAALDCVALATAPLPPGMEPVEELVGS